MPYYEFVCQKCFVIKPVVQKMDDVFSGKCDSCGGTNFEQKVFPPVVQFKGTGFYETDYKQKEKK